MDDDQLFDKTEEAVVKAIGIWSNKLRQKTREELSGHDLEALQDIMVHEVYNGVLVPAEPEDGA